MHPADSAIRGKNILITRASTQAAATASAIEERGGTASFLPCLEMHCQPELIRETLNNPESRDADILFTSRNGVECVVHALGDDLSKHLTGRNITAVGSKTAQALQKAGINADMIPDEASQRGLIKAYRQHGTPQHLIFFRAEEGSDELCHALTHEGCNVQTIHAYRMACPQSDASDIIQQVQAGDIDAVLLGSARTTKNYLQRIGDIEIANTPAIAVISPHVASVAKAAGLNVQAVAKSASFDTMLDALNDYFQQHGA